MKQVSLPSLRFIFTLLFILVGLLLYPVYKYQLNPDGIAYLSIAQHYATGRWEEALNSCWPPLLSWLLAPWNFITDELLWVFKIYNILFGAGCLWISFSLLEHFHVNRFFLITGMLLLSGTYMIWVYTITTPDLLSVWIILLYSYKIITKKFLSQPVLTGLLGGLAYFAKSYCFFFFVAHLSFQFLLFAFLKRASIKQLAITYLKTMGVLFFIAACWMLLLYTKYEKISLSSASSYTHALLKNPDNKCTEGFAPPPGPHAVFAWEDPPLVCPRQDWNVFGSLKNMQLQVKYLYENMLNLLSMQRLTGYSHLIGFLLILFVILFQRLGSSWRLRKWREQANHPLFDLLPLVIIYTMGYLLIFIEPRYVWCVYAWITMGSLVALQNLMGLQILNKYSRIIFALLFFTASIAGIIYWQPRILDPLQKVMGNKNATHNTFDFYNNSQKIREVLPPGSHIAIRGSSSGAQRTQASNLAYFTRSRLFGTLPSDVTISGELIQKHSINVIIMASGEQTTSAFKDSNWVRVSPEVGNLVVYKKKE